MEGDFVSMLEKLGEELPVLIEMDAGEVAPSSSSDLTASLYSLFTALITPSPTTSQSSVCDKFQLCFYSFAQTSKGLADSQLAAECVFKALVRLCESVISLLKESVKDRSELHLRPYLSTAIQNITSVDQFPEAVKVPPTQTIAVGKVLLEVAKMKTALAGFDTCPEISVVADGKKLVTELIAQWESRVTAWLQAEHPVPTIELTEGVEKAGKVAGEVMYLEASVRLRAARGGG